jgi:hypothetical protein
MSRSVRDRRVDVKIKAQFIELYIVLYHVRTVLPLRNAHRNRWPLAVKENTLIETAIRTVVEVYSLSREQIVSLCVFGGGGGGIEESIAKLSNVGRQSNRVCLE